MKPVNHISAFFKKRSFWTVIILAVISSGGYIFVSRLVYSTGYPLDDAWIHQTYARNLAVYGEWAFIPGQISSGSTSPLWSVLLAMGYLMKIPGWLWAMCLGIISLVGIARVGDRIMQQLEPDYINGIPWMALLLVFEWHLVWASVSGMETALYALLIFGVFLLLSQKDVRYFLVGLLVGAAVWVRPDGVTLLGPLFLLAVMKKDPYKVRVLQGLSGLAGFMLVFTPYLLFNRIIAGTWWPNTFYAKQAEYAVMMQIPFYQRFVSLYGLPFIGVGILIFPGFCAAVWQFCRTKNIFGISAVLWWVGYTGIYMMRLPVVYQHGRYLMPAMPVLFLICFYGSYYLLRLNIWQRPGMRIIRSVWLVSIVLVAGAFWWLGAFSYGEDVAIIQTEMVESAKWIQTHTQPDDLIAAHDIGAIGYFSERNLVDLAGLVSPDVIPFIRDEDQLAVYMNQRGVKYLVTFPDWYPELVKQADNVYATNAPFAVRAGGENMVIYRWPSGQ